MYGPDQLSLSAEAVVSLLGEGLTRRKRPRVASIGGVDAAEAAREGADAKRARADEAAAKAAAAGSKPAEAIPGADLPPVLAPPGR